MNQAKAVGRTAVPKAGHGLTSHAGLFDSTNGSTEPQQKRRKDGLTLILFNGDNAEQDRNRNGRRRATKGGQNLNMPNNVPLIKVQRCPNKDSNLEPTG
jgi:hypothetical protein